MLQAAASLTLLLALGACAAPTPGAPSPAATASTEVSAASPAPSVAPATPTPQGAAMSVAVGQRLTIQLPSSGAGGYAWHLDEDSLAGVVKFVEKTQGPAPEPPVPGRFADEVFVLEALKAGKTTLRFHNYREWEGPSEDDETREHAVTVTAAP